MGQKQSYSLNNYKNKNAAQGEVAQTFNTTEPTPVSLKPVIVVKESNDSETTSSISPVDKLCIDQELPFSIFVFDKENSATKDKEIKIDTVFSQPDGLVARQTELEDNILKKPSLPTPTGYEKIVYSSDEIAVEDISKSVEMNSMQPEYPIISSTVIVSGLSQALYPHVEHFTLRINEFNET